MKINVLFVAHEMQVNGSSYSMLNLMDKLSNKCNFIVVTPFYHGPFVEELKKRRIDYYYAPYDRWIEFKDKDFNLLKLKWLVKRDKRNQKVAEDFAKTIRNKRIDIIHSNTAVVDFGYRLSKILKVPHIWHMREFGKEDFNMYPLVSERKFRKTISDDNTIICISKAVMEKYSKFVPKERLHLIYNGVDSNNIIDKRKFTKSKKDKLVLLQTGMITKAKGQDITIKAVDELYNEGNKNIELVLAGRGDLKSLGVPTEDKEWLKYLGQVSNMKEVREKANIEIVSSRKEAFGRVTIEAMMGQIPVIGSNSGGTKELIKDKENGLLFTPGDYKNLKEKIKYLYDNRDEIKRMGINAYNYSKEYFLIDRCAKEVYELYKEVLDRR